MDYWKSVLSQEFLKRAKGYANQIKLNSKIAGYANATGSILGYFGAMDNYLNGDYAGAGIEGGSNTISIILAGTKYGNAGGLAWTGGWEFGRFLSTTEIYNRALFGVHSQIYKERGLENGYTGSRFLDN